MKTHIDLKIEQFENDFMALKFYGDSREEQEEQAKNYFSKMIRGWLEECCLNRDSECDIKLEDLPY
jgi:hypothetical protein